MAWNPKESFQKVLSSPQEYLNQQKILAGNMSGYTPLKEFAKQNLSANTSKEDQAARDALAQQQQAYDQIGLPTLNAPRTSDYQNAWNFDPSLGQVTAQGASSYDQITTDPRLKAQQDQSLAALNEIIAGGGMNAQDKANMAKTLSEVNQADRGRREAILQNQQARGMSGSGQGLLAQLSSAQDATNRQSQMGLDTAGMAQQRALDAMMQSGQLAGSMQQSQFGQEAQKAAARDAIARFNAENQTQGSFNNAQMANTAGLAKQANAQNISNMNVQNRNTAAQVPNTLAQQQFENRTKLAAGKAGGAQSALDYNQAQAQAARNEKQGYINAAIGAGSAAASAYGGKK